MQVQLKCFLFVLLTFSLCRRMFADDSLACVRVQGWGAAPFVADCCTSCVIQTPPKLNHLRSSMLFCQIKDTTFSCRWATSSLPSCCWSSSSSSSSSSHIDTSPKVWRNFCFKTFNWRTNMLILYVLLSFQCFIRSHPQGERQHTYTHASAHLKHTLRCVLWLLRQVWEKSLQPGAFWDGFRRGDRAQPGGEKHRWGTSPPEGEGQVCPHCSFKFYRLVCVVRLQEQPAERKSSPQLSTKGHRSWQR